MDPMEESEFSLSEEEDDGEDSSSSEGALDDENEINLSKKKKKVSSKGKGEGAQQGARAGLRCAWSGLHGPPSLVGCRELARLP